jgi:hypothetical protein
MQRAFSVVALGLGLAAVSSRPALAMAPETVVAHIPFAFNVRNETLPPGDYRLHPLSDLDRQVLEIRSTDGRHAAVVFSEDAPSASPNAKPELVFDRYGQMDFLHAVKLPEATGAILEPSRSEVQAARAIASEQAAHGSKAR